MAVSDSQKFWGRWITTTGVLAILGFFGTFLFTKVTAIPETYPTKGELKFADADGRCWIWNKKIETEVEHVEEKQSDGFKSLEKLMQQVVKAQSELHKDVREIRQKVQ